MKEIESHMERMTTYMMRRRHPEHGDAAMVATRRRSQHSVSIIKRNPVEELLLTGGYCSSGLHQVLGVGATVIG